MRCECPVIVLRVLTLALVSIVGGGCDAVGEPLVDRLPGPPAVAEPPTVECTQPPDCEPAMPRVSPEDEPPRRIVSPVDLSACGVATTRSCALREIGGGVEVGSEVSEADAGVVPALGEPLMSCSPAFDDGIAECETLEVIAEGGEHLVTGLTLRGVNLSIRATRPTSLMLDAASLERVYVAMQGPITLQVLGARGADDLRVVGTRSAEGEPRLELLDVDAERVLAGSAQAAFAGTVRFDRVVLQDAELVAERLDLQSVSLDVGRIEAQTLTAADLQTSAVRLLVGDALLSAFTSFDTNIERCEALTLVSGRLLRSSLAVCSGPPVRVYDTVVLDSRVDGAIESDGSIWERVAFGASEETRLVAFGGNLRSVNFCAGAGQPMLGDGLALSCSKCDGWSEPGQLPCQLNAEAQLTQHSNFCALLDVNSFLACPAPVPERQRPLMLPF